MATMERIVYSRRQSEAVLSSTHDSTTYKLTHSKIYIMNTFLWSDIRDRAMNKITLCTYGNDGLVGTGTVLFSDL